MRISIVQSCPIKGDIVATISLVIEKIERSASEGAELVVFPECYITGGCFDDRNSLEEGALNTADNDFNKLIHACYTYNVHLAIGFYRQLGDKIFNSSVLIGPEGVIGFYYKRHLPFMIGDRFADIPDDKTPAPVFETKIGKIGLAICYEVRFPEVIRTLALKGAQVVIVLAAWPGEAKVLPQYFTKVRASENFVFLIASNRIGTEDGVEFIGMSHVLSPNGDLLGEMGEEEGELLVDINVEEANFKSIIRQPGIYEVHPFKDRMPESYLI